MSNPGATPATTDLCDAHPDIQVCDPVFRAFGGAPAFSGPITTLKVFEDNTLIKQAVESPGSGAGARRRRRRVDALRTGRRQPGRLRPHQRLGRDRRLRLHPGRRRTGRSSRSASGRSPPSRARAERGLHSGQAGIPVIFAGVVFREGEWLCADADGVVVLPGAAGCRLSPSRRSNRARRWVRPAIELGRGRRDARNLGQIGVPLVQPGPDVVRRVGAALALVAGQHGPGGGHAGEAGQSEELPEAHGP